MALILALGFFGCAREHYSLRGAVVDGSGKPVESAFVSLWNASCDAHEGRTPTAMDVTDEKGTFDLDFTTPVRPDVTGLQVQKGGYAVQCIAPDAKAASCQGANCEQLRVVLAKD